VYFFPAAMTPGCTIEAVDFNAALDKLAEAKFEVIGISPDQPTKLAAFKAKEHLSFPLLRTPTERCWTRTGRSGPRTCTGRS
jgi:peroxiredoxin Q/BCP